MLDAEERLGLLLGRRRGRMLALLRPRRTSRKPGDHKLNGEPLLGGAEEGVRKVGLRGGRRALTECQGSGPAFGTSD